MERSWRLLRRSRGALDGSWRLLAAPRALPGRFWRSPGARLEPWELILEPFFFPEALCFRVLRHRSRNRHRLLVFSFGNFRSTWALALVSRAWACALESWALARGSWALAWALALGSWALTLGFRLWGLRLFSSGASALRSWALVSGFSSGAFGCISSSWALALGAWALALGSRALSLAQGHFLSPCSLNRSGALTLRSRALAVRSWPLGFGLWL